MFSGSGRRARHDKPTPTTATVAATDQPSFNLLNQRKQLFELVKRSLKQANLQAERQLKKAQIKQPLNRLSRTARNIRWRAAVNQPIVVCQPVGLEFELQAHDLSRGS